MNECKWFENLDVKLIYLLLYLSLYHQTKVYRSFDNRLRCTERRPDVYKNSSKVNQGYKEIYYFDDSSTRIKINIADSSTTHQFGKPMPSEFAQIDWLWKFTRQLKVIALPYHKGEHYATDPLQLKPIVEYLHEMHKTGYVHGDIRAYNMVLNYEDQENLQGYLIDFDFGGHVDNESPKYPTGYVYSLDDGYRSGEEGKPITFAQDWFALGQIIFVRCYKLTATDHVESVPADVYLYILKAPNKFDKVLRKFEKLLSDPKLHL